MWRVGRSRSEGGGSLDEGEEDDAAEPDDYDKSIRKRRKDMREL